MNLKGYRLAKKKVKPLGVEMKTRAGQDWGSGDGVHTRRKRWDRWVEMEGKVEKECGLRYKPSWKLWLGTGASAGRREIREEEEEEEEEEEGLSCVVQSHWVSSSASCSASLFCSSPERTTQTSNNQTSIRDFHKAAKCGWASFRKVEQERGTSFQITTHLFLS